MSFKKFQQVSVRLLLLVLEFIKRVIPALFLLVPLLYSPGMLWGFGGQLCVSDYPKSWFEVNEFLNKDKDNFRTLFLPWHLYMSFSFACNKIIANPAHNFFDKSVLAGDNMEMGPIYTQSMRLESKYIEKEILGNKLKFVEINRNMSTEADEINRNTLEINRDYISLGEKLNVLNIKYVIWAQDSDFFNYEFVSRSPDLELVFDSKELKVYQNLKY